MSTETFGEEGGGALAGESAREMARRQREKAARLTQAAEKWERGAEGEEATARALAALPAGEWTVFHDRRWPGRKLANVDHVVVGPPGVFVIDSKNWTGKVEVRDQVLRQNGYSREREVASAAESAIAISLKTPDLSAGLAIPVLCFVRDEPIEGWARDVMVCSTANVITMLSTRPPRLDRAQRQRICLGLDLALAKANGPAYTPVSTPVRTPRVPRGTRTRYVARPSARPMRSPRAGRNSSRRRRASAGDKLKAAIGAGILALLILAPTSTWVG